MRILFEILLVMTLGCGSPAVTYCQMAPRDVPGGACDVEDQGHCTDDHKAILYCGGHKWSLITCPKGTSCKEIGDGVSCQ